MTIDEFKAAFAILKAKEWIPSIRKGPTGVGHTLEQQLGLKENNIAASDLGEIELKAHRANSASLITLFTFNRKVWQIKPSDAVRKYGTIDKDPTKNGRLGMYFTLSPKPNGVGLFLHTDTDNVALQHISGEVIAIWTLQTLVNQFLKKIPALILVSAMGEMRGETEYFFYHRAQLLTGTSGSIIRSQLELGNILVDIRLHDRAERAARNHGTAFRVREDHLQALFADVMEL